LADPPPGRFGNTTHLPGLNHGYRYPATRKAATASHCGRTHFKALGETVGFTVVDRFRQFADKRASMAV